MKSLLKFITCGSVDDGKSTLIGHILYDSKLIYADQEKALELDSKVGSRGGEIDYSLLLDGLMAEREQGITIDVAYRYFTTEHRSFIVADTPGHEEYTRNMAVGASFADLSIILIDAKQGVLVQTRRHARICALMGIRHFVFAVNKMDLVDYTEERFHEIEAQVEELKNELMLESIVLIPVSATEGDNITKTSENTPWYQGPTLLSYLENVDADTDQEEEGFYLSVQRVCRPNHNFRGFQGQIETGTVSVGDKVVTLPSNEQAEVKSILVGDAEKKRARAGQPVTIQLDREVDVSRGCVLVSGTSLKAANTFSATLLWMDDEMLSIGKEYVVKVGTKQIVGVVTDIRYEINVNSGAHQESRALTKNQIAVCDISLLEKIVIDRFDRHKSLGEFILIDRISNMTSACGVIEEILADSEEQTGFTENGKIVGNALFDEYYYDFAHRSVTRRKTIREGYNIGERVELRGRTYSYPKTLDVIDVENEAVAQITEGKLERILSLESYITAEEKVKERKVPARVTVEGFEVRAETKQELITFLQAVQKTKVGTGEENCNPLKAEENQEDWKQFLRFDTYRHIGF
ncbi:MAG: GTP-binding protein [Hespellia sp.]|nr:GTP-binding protein [Hespellia sp.]